MSLLLPMALITGCFETGVGGAGFDVITTDTWCLTPEICISEIPHSNARVVGEHQYDTAAATDTVRSFDVTTDWTGGRWVYNGRQPARWWSRVYWNTNCFGQTTNSDYATVTYKDPLIWTCRHPVDSYGDRFGLRGSEPSTITVGGEYLGTQNGPPILNVYNRNGSLVTQLAATNVAWDGTSATFMFPMQGTASLSADIYGMNILNQDTPDQEYCEWDEWQGQYCWTEPGTQRYAGGDFIL